jgi:hypothetical protein
VSLTLIPDALASDRSTKVSGSSRRVITAQPRVSNESCDRVPPLSACTVHWRGFADSPTLQLPSTLSSGSGKRDLIGWEASTRIRGGVRLIGYQYYAGCKSSYSDSVCRKYSPRVITAPSRVSNVSGYPGPPPFSRRLTRSRCLPEFRDALRGALSSAIDHPAGGASTRAPPDASCPAETTDGTK